MKQFETRVEYMTAIAQAMGFDGLDDLPNDHRNVLQVEHFVRLAPILDLVETVAGQSERLPFTEDDSEALAAKIAAINRVLLEHHDSKVKAVQVLVAELNGIQDREEDADSSVPQP